MLGSVALLTGIIAVTLFGWLATAAPASAHGEGETDEGYLLVQQALGHLAHDTGMGGIDAAMEKVQDALDTQDQEGVDVGELKQGMAALEAGNVGQARSLLQDSITQAMQELPPATGTQTGTTKVVPEQPGRAGWHTQDLIFLVASVVALVLGIWLAYLFRPHDSLKSLRSLLGTSPRAPPAGTATGPGGR